VNFASAEEISFFSSSMLKSPRLNVLAFHYSFV
jgi:hypothetical protein